MIYFLGGAEVSSEPRARIGWGVPGRWVSLNKFRIADGGWGFGVLLQGRHGMRSLEVIVGKWELEVWW